MSPAWRAGQWAFSCTMGRWHRHKFTLLNERRAYVQIRLAVGTAITLAEAASVLHEILVQLHLGTASSPLDYRHYREPECAASSTRMSGSSASPPSHILFVEPALSVMPRVRDALLSGSRKPSPVPYTPPHRNSSSMSRRSHLKYQAARACRFTNPSRYAF